MKQRFFLQLAILLLGFGVLFTMTAAETPLLPKDESLLPVSVLPREADSAVWAVTRQGMEQAAADFGVELRILPPAVSNRAADQREVLRRELESGAAAFILTPADASLLSPVVEQLAGKTPVVTLEMDMGQSSATACLGVDNAALGEALALAALNGAAAGERALLLGSSAANNAVSTRLGAAAQVLRQAGREVSICAPYPGQTQAQALEKSLSRRSYSVILAFEPTATEQAVRLTQNLPHPPLIYGAGSSSTIVSYLEQGRITALAAYNEFAAGYLAVQAVAEALRHQSPSPVDTLDFRLIRLENMYELENQKLLFPVTR